MTTVRDDDRTTKLLEAVRDLLSENGWSAIELAIAESRLTASPPGDDTAVVDWLIGRSATTPSSRAMLVVHLHDDAKLPSGKSGDHPEADGWSNYRDILRQSIITNSRAKKGQRRSVSARVGRDILFGISDTAALRKRATAAEQSMTGGPSPSGQRALPAPTVFWRQDREIRARSVEVESLLGGRARRSDPGAAPAIEDRQMVLLTPPDISLNTVIQKLAVSRLLQSFLDDTSPTCVLPLVLEGDDISSRGLENAIWNGLWRQTGLPNSSQFTMKLVGLGFVHLFVMNAHRLRLDYELDPNSALFSDLLSACGLHGAFTLTCRRSHAMHPQAKPPPSAAVTIPHPWLFATFKALGERFTQDGRLALADFGDVVDHSSWFQRSQDRTALWCRTISQNAGGRISELEARRLLTDLAIQAEVRDGGILSRHDLRTTVIGIVQNERKRPESIAFVEAALTSANCLQESRRGYSFHEEHEEGAHLYLQAVAIRHAVFMMDAARETPNADKTAKALDARLGQARYPYEVMAASAEMLMSDEPALVRALLALISRHKMSEPKKFVSGGTLIQENVLTLCIAAAERLDLRGTQRRATFLDRVFKDNSLKLNGLSLVQFSFKDIDLRNWKFQDCNLRRALFDRCRLERIHFADCNLAGAAFIDSSFDKFVKLPSTNLSGSWFQGVKNIGGALAGNFSSDALTKSTWMAAQIASSDKGLPRDTLEIMREAGARIEGFEIAGSERDLLDQRRSYSAQVWRAVLACQEAPIRRYIAGTDEQPLLRVPGALAERFVKFGKVRRAETFLPPAGTLSLASTLVVIERQDVGELYLIGDEASGPRLLARLSTASLFTAICTGDESGVGIVIAILEPPTTSAASQAWQATIIELAHDGKLRNVRELHRQPGMDLSDYGLGAWLPTVIAPMESEHGAGKPQIVIGCNDGSLCALTWADDTQWSLRRLTKPMGRPPVRTIGFDANTQILTIAHEGGLVVGERIMSNHASEVFRFFTTVKFPTEIVVIGRSGQMLLIGATADAGRELPFCVLFAASGDVAAVFPLHVPREAGQSLDDDFAGLPPIAVVQAARRSELFENYAPTAERVSVRPFVDQSFELSLSARQGIALDPVVEDEDGQWFREVTVHLQADDELESIGFTEGELVGSDDHQLAIKSTRTSFVASVPSVFSRKLLDTATASMHVRYARPGALPKERTFTFTTQLFWRDNPFDASGRPVSGEAFWGRSELLQSCFDKMANGHHIVVRGARRMGKSSLLESLAQRLHESGRVAVVVSLVGMTNVNAEFPGAVISAVERRHDRIGKRLRQRVGRGDLTALTDELMRVPESNGMPGPVCVIIDEWGVVSNVASEKTRDDRFLGDIGEKIYKSKPPGQNQLAYCLSGTPSDFRHPHLTGQSDPYRGGLEWFDLGPVTRNEIASLIRAVKAREAVVADEDSMLDRLCELSSGDPLAAVLLMQKAYDSAVQREGNKIELQAEDLTSEEVLEALRQHYVGHRHTTLARFQGAALDALRKMAQEAVPQWENADNPIEIPNDTRPDADPRRWRVFDDAGFRRVKQADREGRFYLWIPRGMTLDIREYTGDAR